MNLYRLQEKNIKNHFKKFKQALILLGARQVGKTTLLKKLFPNALYLLVDEKRVFDILETYNSATYKTLIGSEKQIIIDELHLISNPGRAVKLIYDQIPNTQIIITGSSSLHIKNKTSESMAGRAINYFLHPLTFWEYLFQIGIETEKKPFFLNTKILEQDGVSTIKIYNHREILEEVMVYGLYPETLNQSDKKTYLTELAEKAIFKDIIELQLIENRAKALELLKLLAYQIGSLISYTELSNKLGISTPTVQRYIDVFEDSFILFRVYPYSKKGRNEIGKAPKIYFWDTGIRNALIGDFNKTSIRNDAGALFENLVFVEYKKELVYLKLNHKLHYWRLKSGAEVDLVVETKQELIGCEIKLTKGKVSPAFTNRYPNSKIHVLTMDNIF